MNDGLMIPAKGFQTLLSAGVYAKLGPLSIQFQPEYLYAENKAYNGFAQEHTDLSWSNYYNVYNAIDLPERFGNGPYQKATWGQSSIRLTFGPASIGVSNENLWWGPGIRNSLLMSNSAPGFKHIALNTVRPIKTPIGSFEGQLVAGRLENSGFLPPSKDHNNPIAPWYVPKPDYWRYFNGIVLSYQPKWVPGLFLGATRAFQTYNVNLGKDLVNYLPVILPMRKKVITDMDEELLGRDQLASLFVRWLWLKQNAELYAEYARGDHAADLRDLYLDPNHTAAFLVGMRKMVPLKRATDQFIQVNVEFTHLESVVSEREGSAPSPFYVHYQVTQGYTNQGQMLGAGIGPGSNLQTLNVSWVHGLKVIGIQMERYLHNNDLHKLTGLDFRNIWADYITSLVGAWDYKNLVVTLKLDAIISFNYQFRYNPTDGRSFWDHGKDVYSAQALLGVMYRF
jgi:hypothetical protein